MIPLKPDPERGIAPERVKELIAQVDAEHEAAAAAAIEPLPQEDAQWARAAAPEQWRPSPGIEAMNKMYPSSEPLTRERPPTPRTKVTLAQAKEIKRAMFGWRMWLMPWMKREFAELYEVIDAPTEPMPIPEYVGHHDAIIASRKAAAAAMTKRAPIAHKEEPKKPRQGTTFFTGGWR